jgi:hypothetical protein
MKVHDWRTMANDDSTDGPAEDSAEDETPPKRPLLWWLRRHATQIGLALTAAALIVAVVTLLNDFGVFTSDQRTPAPQPEVLSTPLFDDFSAGEISPAKWIATAPPALFTAPAGELRVETPGSGAPVEGTLVARPPTDVSRVEFDMTLRSPIGTTSDGGLYVTLVGENGQRRIVVGPGQNVGQDGFGIESCATTRCPPEDNSYLGDRVMELGRPYHVVIDAGTEKTTYTVEGFTEVFEAPPLGAVDEVRIYTYAEEDDRFDVAIDNVRFG